MDNIANTKSGSYGGIDWSINVENPNETLDMGLLQRLMNPSHVNVAGAGADMAQEMYVQRLRNYAQGGLKGKFLNEGFDHVAQMREKEAMENATNMNATYQKTNIGQLADMIANSQNNNNRAIMSSLGQTLGVKLAFDPEKFISANKYGLMQMQKAEQKKAQDEAMARHMAMLAMARSAGGGSRGGYSGGSRGSGASNGLGHATRSEMAKLSELSQLKDSLLGNRMNEIDKGTFKATGNQEDNGTVIPTKDIVDELNEKLAKIPDSEEKRQFEAKVNNDVEFMRNHVVNTYGSNWEKYQQQ